MQEVSGSRLTRPPTAGLARQSLREGGAAPVTADLMYRAVSVFGNTPGASFAWGFARGA